MIKCSIIGYGKMGQIRAKAIEASGRGEVVGVYDARPLDNVGYKVYENDFDAIHDESVEAVFVCTPNHRIVPLCKEALGRGKHVFSEKPPARTAAGVEEVRAVEAGSGKVLMYGFNHRHHASIVKMKEVLESGELGKILWMRGRYGKEVDDSFFQGWRADKDLAGGGIMLDQGIHMLDLFLHLGGSFDEVHALVSNLLWKIEGIEDNVFAIFRSSETGICASLHSTMTQWRYLFSLEVFCEQGALILNGLKTSSGAYGDEDLAIKRNASDQHGTFSGEEHLVYHADTSWDSEIGQFFDAVEGKAPVKLGTSSDALELMRIMDRIYDR
jgi:predicted dehydrogenase